MTGAMYAAIAGLRTHMQNLNVIGNNVANVNTNGYKASRAVFKTSLYTTLTGGSNGTAVMGGTNPSQIGYGANVSTVDIDMSTGNYAVTGKSTDLMLDGDGFFLVGGKDIAGTFRGDAEDVGRLTSLYLTRVGNFEFKADGYFANNDGNCVYGFQCIGKWGTKDFPMYYTNEQGEYTDAAGTVLQDQTSPVLLPNVPTGTKEGGPVFSDQLVPIRYPQVRSETVWYQKNEDGSLLKLENPPDTTAADYNADNYVSKEEMTIVYPNADKSGIYSVTENGKELPMGQFQLITVDQNTGLITGVSNETGEVVTIGCVAVGVVTNPNGVTSMGDNYFKASNGSGDLTVAVLGGNAEAMGIKQINASLFDGGTDADGNAAAAPSIDGLRPRTGGDTSMLSNGLEMSKTDLAQEIANMILTQRGYQANTRIITVTDSMLEDLVNMKR